MNRDFENCGWASRSLKISGMYDCKKKKWHLLPADKGTGLCPCQFWVKKPIPSVKKPKKGLKSDQKGELL